MCVRILFIKTKSDVCSKNITDLIITHMYAQIKAQENSNSQNSPRLICITIFLAFFKILFSVSKELVSCNIYD